jgi:hypothetical protein
MPMPEEKDQYSANHALLAQYKQQANLLLSKHNYTPLVISRNELSSLHNKAIAINILFEL